MINPGFILGIFYYKYYMKLNEAIKLLQNNDYVVESNEFNPYEQERYGKFAELNKASIAKRTAPTIANRPFDASGKKWIYVKKRDTDTLKSAALDGLIDSDICMFDVPTPEEYRGLTSKEELDELLQNYPEASNAVTKICNFLKQYTKGMTRVYRGLNVTEEDYTKATNGNVLMNNLIKIYNNKGKEFNSFTTDIDMAYQFAETGNNDVGIVISADVEPNDINYAMSAYLMGMMCSVREKELNINNLKDLKDLTILDVFKV